MFTSSFIYAERDILNFPRNLLSSWERYFWDILCI